MKMNATFWVIPLSFVLATIPDFVLADSDTSRDAHFQIPDTQNIRNLHPGFESFSVRGVSGGKQRARGYGRDCSGWIADTPDHIIQLHSGIKMALNVERVGDFTDPVLVLRMTDERALCDDNSADGVNPQISADFPPGSYEVFIGNREKNQHGRYVLTLTENGRSAAADIPPFTRDHFSNLMPGFGARTSIGAIGSPKVRASDLGKGCVGWIEDKPRHSMIVNSAVNVTVSTIRGRGINATEDPTLLIKASDGGVLCDDNSADGINPKISAEFLPGRYEVFVGNIQKDGYLNYFLTVTENAD